MRKMSSSAGIAGSVIGILGTFVYFYNEIVSKFIDFMHYMGYSDPIYISHTDPTAVTKIVTKLILFPKLYFEIMYVSIPYLRQLITAGDINQLIFLFTRYFVYLFLPFLVGGLLCAILVGGSAKSISSALMGVLTSYILVELLLFFMNHFTAISGDSIILDLLGIVILGSIFSGITAGIFGALTGKIYGSNDEIDDE